MATDNVPARHVGSPKNTLVAHEPDTVTFNDPWAQLQIWKDDGGELWFTTDGSEPTVGGTNSFYMPAPESTFTVERDPDRYEPESASEIKLLSPETPTYRVSRLSD